MTIVPQQCSSLCFFFFLGDKMHKYSMLPFGRAEFNFEKDHLLLVLIVLVSTVYSFGFTC